MILDLHSLPVLESERLRLEPLAVADAASLYPVMGDPEVMAYSDMPEVDDPDVVARIVRGWVEDMDAGRAIHWAMRTLAGGDLLGCCTLSEIDRRQRRAEVALLMGREAWSQGYAPEAMRSVVAFAAASGLRKLAAHAHLGARPEALLETFGFESEGLLRGQRLKDGERRDCRLFGLLL